MRYILVLILLFSSATVYSQSTTFRQPAAHEIMTCYGSSSQQYTCSDVDCGCLGASYSGGSSSRSSFNCATAGSVIRTHGCSYFTYHYTCGANYHVPNPWSTKEECYQAIRSGGFAGESIPFEPQIEQQDTFNCPPSADPIAYYSSTDFCSDYDCCKANMSNMSSSHTLYDFCSNRMYGDELVQSTQYYNNNCLDDGSGDGDDGGDGGGDDNNNSTTDDFPCGLPSLDPCYVYDEAVEKKIADLMQLTNATNTKLQQQTQEIISSRNQGFTDTASLISAINQVKTAINNNGTSGGSTGGGEGSTGGDVNVVSSVLHTPITSILTDLNDFSNVNHQDLEQIHTDLVALNNTTAKITTELKPHLQDIKDFNEEMEKNTRDIEYHASAIDDTTDLIADRTKKLLELFSVDGDIQKLLKNEHINISGASCPDYTAGARLDKSSITLNCSGDEYKCHQAEYIFKLRCANYLYQMERLELLQGSNATYTCPTGYLPMIIDGSPACRFKSYPYCNTEDNPDPCYSQVLNFNCNPNGGDAFQPLVDVAGNGFACDTRANSVKHAGVIKHLTDISQAVTPIKYHEFKCHNSYVPTFEKVDTKTIKPICLFNDSTGCGGEDQGACKVDATIHCPEGYPQISPSINGFICQKQFQATQHNDLVYLLQQIIGQDMHESLAQQASYEASESYIRSFSEAGRDDIATSLESVDSSDFAKDVTILGVTLPLSSLFSYFLSVFDSLSTLVNWVFAPSCIDPVFGVSAFGSGEIKLFEGMCTLLTPVRTLISYYFIYITFSVSISMFFRAIEGMSYAAMGSGGVTFEIPRSSHSTESYIDYRNKEINTVYPSSSVFPSSSGFDASKFW